MTQEFFARLLAHHSLERMALANGRFSSFLLAALRHFLCDQHDHDCALKRGGGSVPLSLDALTLKNRDKIEPVEHLDAERLYERGRALEIFENAMGRLRDESIAAGKGELFEQLRSRVAGESQKCCLEAGYRLGLSESALKSALHRMRVRYRELVRQEIGRTLQDASEFQGELRHLLEVLSK